MGSMSSDNLVPAIQDLARAQATYPEDLRGQQEHFARVLPEAERRVRDLLEWHLSAPERRALAEVVQVYLDDQDQDNLEDSDEDWDE